MKYLAILLLVNFSIFAANEENMGGTLVTKKDGYKLEVRCVEVMNNVCDRIGIFQSFADNNLRFTDYVESSLEEVPADAYRDASRSINETYGSVYIYGTAAGVIYCSDSHFNLEVAKCIFTIPVGVAVDILKFPFVSVVHITHKFRDVVAKGRFKKLLKFLLDSKNIGKIKKVSYRDFDAIRKALREK